MSNDPCIDHSALVDPYLDHELAEEERRDLEHHVARCSACGELLRAREAILDGVRRHVQPPEAPALLRKRILQSLDDEDQRAESQARRARLGWLLPGAASVAAAAALLLFVSSFWQGSATRETAALAHESEGVAQEAVRQRFRPSPMVVQGTRNEVSRSAKEYLRVPVRPPRFSHDDANLLGWQPGQLRGRDAAVFVYEVVSRTGRHQVNVHALDARDLDLRGKDRVSVDDTELWVDTPFGFSSVSYKDREGIGYVFTSDMAPSELVNLVGKSDILDMINERLRHR